MHLRAPWLKCFSGCSFTLFVSISADLAFFLAVAVAAAVVVVVAGAFLGKEIECVDNDIIKYLTNDRSV